MRLTDLTGGSVDARPLAIARIGVGLAALLKALIFVPVLTTVLAPGALVATDWPWLPRPSLAVLPILLVTWCTAAVLLTIGWRSRWAAATLSALVGYLLALDQQLYSHHLYLLALLTFLLALSDPGAIWSLDASRGQARATVPAWPARLIRVQLSIVYIFGALSKVNVYWLSGALLASELRRGGLIVLPEPLASFPAVACLAIAAVVVELYLAVALWSPRLHRPALLLGVAMHVGFTVLIPPADQLLVFSVECLALYPLAVGLPRRRVSDAPRPAALPALAS
jgi:hypothetical protein